MTPRSQKRRRRNRERTGDRHVREDAKSRDPDVGVDKVRAGERLIGSRGRLAELGRERLQVQAPRHQEESHATEQGEVTWAACVARSGRQASAPVWTWTTIATDAPMRKIRMSRADSASKNGREKMKKPTSL